MRKALFALNILGAVSCLGGASVCCATVAGVQWNRALPLDGCTIAYLLRLLATADGDLLSKLRAGYQEQPNANLNQLGQALDSQLGMLAEQIKDRYNPGARSIDELRSSIENALYSVREGDLYDKLAKFVGRINIGNNYTATGTIIKWDGMDPKLEGRVVLTVAHNYYDNLDKVAEFVKNSTEKIGGFDTIVESPRDNDTLGTESNMSFMIDLSENSRDVVVYAPGAHQNLADANHKVVKVSKVYCIGQNYDWAGIPDVAIFILEEPALEGGAVLDNTEFGIGEEYRSVGYGMAFVGGDDRTYYEKYVGGWNAKKATLPFTVTGKKPINSENPSFPNALISDTDTVGERAYGNSDSGSPIINGDSKIAAVFTGGFSVEIAPLLGWIKAVGEHAASH